MRIIHKLLGRISDWMRNCELWRICNRLRRIGSLLVCKRSLIRRILNLLMDGWNLREQWGWRVDMLGLLG